MRARVTILFILFDAGWLDARPQTGGPSSAPTGSTRIHTFAITWSNGANRCARDRL